VELASDRTGRLSPETDLIVQPEPYFAFIPKPLPPDPALNIDIDLQEIEDKANRALGRLDGITYLLPDPALFLYQYVRKEAVLSSQIEGTQSSISDLLTYEIAQAPGVPIDDAKEVSNYVAAQQYGLDRIKSGMPLSHRLIREIHEILLSGTRGKDKRPGEFRTRQNWLAGTTPSNARYVPPPAREVFPAMSALEAFLHGKPKPMPLLIKAGLAHAQFETIHPFLDGNGRIGRLLITLILCAEGALSEPLLYLSLYFKRNRDHYYETLQRVRTHGGWEEWLKFYLEGVYDVSSQATDTARRIMALFEEDRNKIHTLRKAAPSALAVHELLKKRAIVTISVICKECNLSRPAATNAIKNLIGIGIVHKMSDKARSRLFIYSKYLEILLEGTES
jgi:Fic family protein